MKKSAFTMLELVFVIVVIGILAAAIFPRMDRDTIYEASEQLLSHIKYTQHLAMTDNVYDDSDDDWYEERWRITLDPVNDTYSVSKATGASYAVDPLTKKDIDATDDYNLASKYSVDLTTPNNILVFDHLGRPHTDVTGASHVADILLADFNITLSSGGDVATITVTAETGYSFITYN